MLHNSLYSHVRVGIGQGVWQREKLINLKQTRNYVCLGLGGVVLSQSFPLLIVYFRRIPVVNALILHRTC